MKIVDIRCRDVKFGGSLKNAVINFSEMTTTVVAVVTDVVRDGKPVIGYGFNSPGRYGQSGILNSRVVPRILNSEPKDLLNDNGDNFSPNKIFSIMLKNEKPGGHGDRAHAIGALDTAIWDLVSKIENKPLWKCISERYNCGAHSDKVFCYAAGGYYPDASFSTKKRNQMLKDEIKSYLDLGFTVAKMKVGGAELKEDMIRIEEVLSVTGNGSLTAVDANGKLDFDTAIKYAKAMEKYDLLWFEEPGDPNDYSLHSILSSQYNVPIAIGENSFSTQDMKNFIIHGNLKSQVDYLQPDANLAYGVTGFIKIIEAVKKLGWKVDRVYPHGGNLVSLHLTAALQLGGSECYPGVFKPFGGFGDGVIFENGYVSLPNEIGVGIETKNDLYEVFRDLMK